MAHSASSIISLSDTDLIEQSTLTPVNVGQRFSSCSLTDFLFFSRSCNQKNETSSKRGEKNKFCIYFLLTLVKLCRPARCRGDVKNRSKS